jgi:hypothetical protein
MFRVSITKPQLILGYISQMIAGLTHNVSPSDSHLSLPISQRSLIVTGDEDNLIHPSGSERIKAAMDLAINDQGF